jgi:hypothetical protein
MFMILTVGLLGGRLLRLCALGFGILLVWIAVCVYEDEFGHVKNVLDTWWAKLERTSTERVSHQAAFMQLVANETTKIFDALFGPTLLSLRSIGVTSSLAAASFLLSVVLGRATKLDISVSLFIFILVLFFVVLGLAPLRIKKRTWLLAWFALTLLPLFLWGFLISYAVAHDPAHSSGQDYTKAVGEVVPAVFLSFMSNFLFIALTRWQLRSILAKNSFISMLLTLSLNCLVAFTLVGLPVILSKAVPEAIYVGTRWGAPLALSARLLAFLNFIDALAAGLFVLFALAMLSHRLFWPFASHTIYGLANMGAVKYRKLIGTVGVALIGSATTTGKEILKTVLDKILS